MAERRQRGLLFDDVLPQARRTVESLLSLEPQEDASTAQQAIEAALGFVPGIGQAMALRDIERARRAGDPAGAALAATEFIPFGRAISAMRRAPTASVAESEVPSLVDLFNRQAKREVDFTNQRLERTSGAGEYITFSPAQSLSDIDNDMSYAGLSSKANLLEQIGKDQGFKTKVEGSNKSGSQYIKFYKELDDGEIDFKIRVSDHPDVSRFSPIYEKKALDLNPDSTESISDAIDFLRDQNKVKKFYEEF